MRIVDPKDRPKPFTGARTHARLRHDYATWHESHLSEALATPGRKLPFPFDGGGKKFLDKARSKFDTATSIEDAIKRSEEHPAQVKDGSNDNFVITFDMGYEVGFDAQAQRRTSAVTVILHHTGEVITVHPGTPWSKDWTNP